MVKSKWNCLGPVGWGGWGGGGGSSLLSLARKKTGVSMGRWTANMPAEVSSL